MSWVKKTVKGKEEWVYQKPNKHGGNGRRRRWGFTINKVRQMRPCMVKKPRPKGAGKKDGGKVK
jgi:hypothetical protein